MQTRLYRPSDLEVIIQIFYDSVHQVCIHDYTPEQLEAWAPQHADLERWEASLNKNHTIVLEDNKEIIGFANIGETGYLDRLYISKDHLRQGGASRLLRELEKYARAKGLTFIDTASSITARPFFESQGFKVMDEQIVERQGIRLRRYLMEKKI